MHLHLPICANAPSMLQFLHSKRCCTPECVPGLKVLFLAICLHAPPHCIPSLLSCSWPCLLLMTTCLCRFSHFPGIAVDAALAHGLQSWSFVVLFVCNVVGSICVRSVGQFCALRELSPSVLPNSFRIHGGPLGIPCFEVFSLRLRALARGDCVQHPSRHLAGLLHMLLLVRRHFRFYQIRCASMRFLPFVPPHVPQFECVPQCRPFPPPRPMKPGVVCLPRHSHRFVRRTTYTRASQSLFFFNLQMYAMVISFVVVPFSPHATIVCSNVFQMH